MNKLKSFFSLIIVSVFFVFAANAQKLETVKIKTSAVTNICKAKVEKAVNSKKGVESAVLNLDSKIVEVKYNPGITNPDEIRKTISKSGYNADNVKADPTAYNKLPKECKTSHKASANCGDSSFKSGCGSKSGHGCCGGKK